MNMTPLEAIKAGLRLSEYAKQEHGREHNVRIEEFRTLAARKIAASVTNPEAPATRGDIALLMAAVFAHNVGYSMNHDAQRDAWAAAKGIEAMGGDTGRMLL